MRTSRFLNKNTNKSVITLTAVLTITIIFIIWANFSKIEQITRCHGVVIAKSRTQVIQTAIDGIIDEVLITEGEKIRKGQILAKLERKQAEAAHNDSLGKVAALEAALVRLHAEVFDAPMTFAANIKAYPQFVTNQTELYKRRKQALRAEIGALEESARLVREELDLNLPLLKSGDIGKIEFIRLQRQLSDLTGQISLRRNKYFQEGQAEMTKTEEELATQRQILAERSAVMERLEIRSPADGLVKRIQLTTPGAKVRPGDVVMELLPTDSGLIIEGKLQTSEIAFIRPGMPAAVKFDAYDYSIYGVFHGHVAYVSPDAITEETRQGEMMFYRVHVKLNETDNISRNGKSIEIQPGMTAGIDIRTGEKTIMHYLSKPIIKVFHESLNER
jgi:multidrug efflux pump subunit AcrA (membrane-fusion protein)